MGRKSVDIGWTSNSEGNGRYHLQKEAFDAFLDGEIDKETYNLYDSYFWELTDEN